jgi:zinc protease
MDMLARCMVLLLLCFSFYPRLSWAVDDSTAEALKIKFPVEKFVLDNGLTVLLHEDHSIPMISYHTWYRVGSRDEQPGVTGAAHMLEHMMFKGAKKYSGKQFDAILHQNGIQNNAFTTSDYTGFYENLPSAKLELIMDMEVDRMRDLALLPEALTSELQVVGEERRWRVDNNPPALLREVMMDKLYTVHPYHWPTLGYMKDIQAYTVDKLRHFYENYYVPNNAVLVIAGDIDPVKTKKMVEKYYGVLQSKHIPERKFLQEPDMVKEKRVQTEAEVQNTTVIVAYKGVAAGNPDEFALDLLANILGSGTSSRLYKKMVYQSEQAAMATSYDSTTADPGYFLLMASMKPGISAQPAEKVFAQEIKAVQDKLVSNKELEKAKNQIMKDFVDGLQTLDGRAESLAVNEIVQGDYHHIFDDLPKYQAVTPADIRRVARQYLQPQRKLTAVLNTISKK